MTSAPAVADDQVASADDNSKHVTGTILSVSYATGEMLIYQDSGSLLALYGIQRQRLRDIGAGDRVAVTFDENLEVAAIERLELQIKGVSERF